VQTNNTVWRVPSWALANNQNKVENIPLPVQAEVNAKHINVPSMQCLLCGEYVPNYPAYQNMHDRKCWPVSSKTA